MRPSQTRGGQCSTCCSSTPATREEFEDALEAEQKAILGEYIAISQTPASSAATSCSRRHRDHGAGGERRALTTDGPFAETKEVLGGYYLLEADDLDRALEVAARIPAARMGGAVEVRPRGGALSELERVLREEWGRVLATLIGFLGDFDLAEDAAQEAFALAAERWPRDGTPANPRRWLVTTARNRAIDRIRRDRTLAAKTKLLEVPRPWMTSDRRDRRSRTSGSS